MRRRKYEVSVASDHDTDVVEAAMAWLADEVTRRLRLSDPTTDVIVTRVGLGEAGSCVCYSQSGDEPTCPQHGVAVSGAAARDDT